MKGFARRSPATFPATERAKRGFRSSRSGSAQRQVSRLRETPIGGLRLATSLWRTPFRMDAALLGGAPRASPGKREEDDPHSRRGRDRTVGPARDSRTKNGYFQRPTTPIDIRWSPTCCAPSCRAWLELPPSMSLSERNAQWSWSQLGLGAVYAFHGERSASEPLVLAHQTPVVLVHQPPRRACLRSRRWSCRRRDSSETGRLAFDTVGVVGSVPIAPTNIPNDWPLSIAFSAALYACAI